MKKLLITVFLLTATSALAQGGSITITVVNDAGATVATRAFAISTAHILRLIAAFQTRYGQVASGPPVGGVTPMRNMTNAETLTAWLNGFMQGSVDAVAQEEKKTAHDAAVAGVTPITAQ